MMTQIQLDLMLAVAEQTEEEEYKKQNLIMWVCPVLYNGT